MSWEVYFQGSGCTKHVQPSSWLLPPNGVPKLNIGGSVFSDVRSGGYGGLIRDSMGVSLYNYSGSVEVSDSIEAEVCSMLVGPRIEAFRRI